MGEKTFIISIVLFNVIFIAFIAGIIAFIRQYKLKKKEHESELKQIDSMHKKELLQTQIEIQRQTMAHIGREIHDNIGQKLTLASIYAKQFSHKNQTTDALENMDRINGILNDSLVELRRLSKTLTDDTIEKYSIQKLIEIEVEKIRTLKQCHIESNLDGTTEIYNYQTKTVLLRIVQEFIQNSLKHSQCEDIEVSLTKKGRETILELKDNGKGFDTNSQKQGIGLKNMQKRIEMIQGEYSLTSTHNIGTKLLIKIPNE